MTIYTPDQWYDVIANAKRSVSDPIKVFNVDQSMVFDWKDLSDKLNLVKDNNGNAVPWTKLRETFVDGRSPHTLKYKINLDDPEVTVSTRKVGRPVNLKDFEPKKVYDKPLSITKLKYQDLVYYCDHNFIPPEHQPFYRSLAQATEVTGKEVGEADEPEPVAGRARRLKPRRATSSGGRKTKRPKRTPPNVEEESDSDLSLFD